ncbi:MAG: hypothetical protein D6689_22240 [Deltaproteobacteria bacterium]|nr:MAG: hypothetical protein D6689_22240 [Deltaproteobacteria bacterium]
MTRDGLLRFELRLDTRQRRALYERFEELRRAHGAPLSDAECLALLVEDFFVGPQGLVPDEDDGVAVAV